MKDKKGFTLIELLAIIIILAIIAVITVPVIFGIIDNSKKGAIKDSAFGYVDSINKFYFSNSLNNIDNEFDDGIYTVLNLKTMGLIVDGKEPSDGWVEVYEGNVISYSLKFDDYVVTKDVDTDPVVVLNGNLKRMPGTVEVGDLVCYGPEGEEECFKVLKKYTDNGIDKALLFSRYCLERTLNYKQNELLPTFEDFSLSATMGAKNYWMNEEQNPKELKEKYTNNGEFSYDSSIDMFVNADNKRVFPYVYDLNSDVYSFIEGYLTFLKSETYGMSQLATGRLLTYEEVSDTSIFPDKAARNDGLQNLISNNSKYWGYWIGSAFNDEEIGYVYKNGIINNTHYFYNANFAVRPVIEVPVSDVVSHVVEQ